MAHFSAGLIAGIALTVAAGSFVILRERYYGRCVFPGEEGLAEFAIFWLLPIQFFVAFVVLISLLTHPLLRTTAPRPTQAWLRSIGLALTIYAVVASIAWLMDPVPIRVVTGTPAERVLYSVFWPIGLLVETGNFGPYACGQ